MRRRVRASDWRLAVLLQRIYLPSLSTYSSRPAVEGQVDPRAAPHAQRAPSAAVVSSGVIAGRAGGRRWSTTKGSRRSTRRRATRRCGPTATRRCSCRVRACTGARSRRGPRRRLGLNKLPRAQEAATRRQRREHGRGSAKEGGRARQEAHDERRVARFTGEWEAAGNVIAIAIARPDPDRPR